MNKYNEYDPKRMWVIELTEQQLIDVIDDVEDIHRFLSGQTGLDNTTQYVKPMSSMFYLRSALRDLHSLVTPELDHGQYYDWAGTHCPNDAQREKIKRSYAVYRNLRHCVTKFRGVENVYTRETLCCGEPLAICYPKQDDLTIQGFTNYYTLPPNV